MRKWSPLGLLPLILPVVLSGGTSGSDPSAAYEVNRTESRVEFLVHSFFADVDGVLSSYQVTFHPPDPRIDDMSFAIKAEAGSVQTGSPDKDKMVKGQHFFWVEKYPSITLVSRHITPDPGDPSRFKMEGDFTLRGLTMPVTAQLTLEPEANGHRRLRGELSFDRREFGMTYNMPFNHISDSVQVRFDLDMNSGPRT